LTWRRGPLLGIPLAILLCGATAYVRIALDPYFQVPAIFIFGPAVMLSTLFGGLAAGVLSLLLATLASWYFFLDPAFSWTLTRSNALALILFIVVFGADVALIEFALRIYRINQTDRRRMSVALRAANMGLWRGEAVTGRRQWSLETMELFDYAGERDPRTITGLSDFIHPDDVKRYRDTMARVIADPLCDEYDVEYRLVRRNGEVRWVRSRARISRLADGTAQWLDGGVMDITRQKMTERHLELLLFELQHRIKNFHAVVQAIAYRTLPDGDAMKSGRDLFLSRLMALSRTNIMMVHQQDKGLSLGDILSGELTAFTDQVEVKGCAVLLKPNVAQSFALVVHELATNAIKYGALATPAGRVLLNGSSGNGQFRFTWQETGGAMVEPTAREGYGRTLLANLCEGLGRATWTLKPTGLEFELICDMVTLTPTAPPAEIALPSSLAR
jgi:two-component sensor histidine kinase